MIRSVPQRARYASVVALTALAGLGSAQFEEGHVRVLLDATKGSAGDLFGWRTVALGDVNGDGIADFAASAPFDDRNASSSGTVFALSGSDGATLWSRAETLSSSILGFALETLDWNGDGVLDVVASAPFNSTGGRVRILSGTDGELLQLLTAAAPGDGFGASLATGGDFDGDGLPDLAIGAIGVDTASGADAGRVYVFARGASVPFATFDGPAEAAEMGLGLAFLGDVSAPADGRDELVVGYRLASFVDGEARVVSLVGGTPTELYTVSGVGMGPDLIGDRIEAGLDPALDLDGDGAPDFLVGDLTRDQADVFSGRTGAHLYTLVGDADSGNFGVGTLIEDLDRDGHADLVFGAWSSDAGALDSGRVYRYSGATGALLGTITPSVIDRGLGCEVRSIDDFDGDGTRDLLVGAYGNGGLGAPVGRLYVLSGRLPAPPNLDFPAQLAGDPVLRDSAGDPGSGPLVGSVFDPFDLALDCSGFTAGGPYTITGRRFRRAEPKATPQGDLWTIGAVLFRFQGTHAAGEVHCVPGGLVLPPNPALIGLRYTCQGLCGGGSLRLSNALTQTIGG